MQPPLKDLTLSIVIPVFNSEKTLPELVDRIAELSIPGGLELILVNDGSSDASGRVCSDLAAAANFPITLVDLARNFGEHNAVMAGLCRATGQFTIIMDDDFQNPLHEIQRLLEHAQKTGADVVYTYSDERRHARWRNAGSSFANRVADVVLDKPRGLYLSSFKCLSAFAVAQVILYKGPFPYIDGLILQATSKIESLKVDHELRAKGRSGYTLKKLVGLWLSMFVNFSVAPLRIATVLGLLFAFLGLAAAIPVIIEAWLFSTPSGWGSLMASLLVFSGIQLMMLGVIGEYLGRLHLTLNAKPQFVVRRVCQSRSKETAK